MCVYVLLTVCNNGSDRRSPEAVYAGLQRCSAVLAHAVPTSQQASVTLHSVQQSDDHGLPGQQRRGILLNSVTYIHTTATNTN